MLELHLAKMRLHDRIEAAEEQALRDSVGQPVDCPAGTVLVRRGEPLSHSILLLDGMLARYKDLSNGQRQITHVHVAGDFADIHGYILGHLDENVVALTAARIVRVPHAKLDSITERFPHLLRIFWFATERDASIHREWIVSLGRRSAIQRLAHLFCELHLRLQAVGLASGDSFRLPITQADLAECLGLTGVHVNRVLRELRERKLADFRSGTATLLDRTGLAQLAEFDPLYLYLEKRAD